MKRELKFRAWNHKSKTMYYNVCIDMYGNANDGISYLTYDKEKDDVMQYIGLKDGKGKHIYENDIVVFSTNGSTMAKMGKNLLGVIEWGYDSFVLRVKGQEESYSIANETDEFYAYSKVIGNIYETPELIK